MTQDWLCNCGNYIEDGLHCPLCGHEPPWGCPCDGCQGYEDDNCPNCNLLLDDGFCHTCDQPAKNILRLSAERDEDRQ